MNRMMFELITDHKPLESIYGPRSKLCALIVRWVLRLQPYTFMVIYWSGQENIADPLSRMLSPEDASQSHQHKAEEYVHFVAAAATPKALKRSWNMYAKPFRQDGSKSAKLISLVMPEKLRPTTLTLALEEHLGIVGTRQILRTKE